MTVESENMDKYFVTKITVWKITNYNIEFGKLEALAVEISPVSVSARSQLLFVPQSCFQKSYLVIFCQGFSVKFGDLDWR